MSYKKMVLIILLFSAVFVLGLITYNKLTKVNYTLTEYEEKLIDYFKEVALNAEFDYKPDNIIKWKKPMVLYVIKEKESQLQMKALKDVVHAINELTSDGFKIELTEDKSKCNSVLYLLSKDKVEELDSKFLEGIDEDFVGLSEARYSLRNNIIISAKIFIDIRESLEVQKSIILEEVTQSIGLLNDSEKYTKSVFYQHQMEKDTVNKKFSPIDKDIIKLLYHPRMKPNLNIKRVERVIKKILKNKEIELSGGKGK